MNESIKDDIITHENRDPEVGFDRNRVVMLSWQPKTVWREFRQKQGNFWVQRAPKPQLNDCPSIHLALFYPVAQDSPYSQTAGTIDEDTWQCVDFKTRFKA